jgi:hypothetical protein
MRRLLAPLAFFSMVCVALPGAGHAAPASQVIATATSELGHHTAIQQVRDRRYYHHYYRRRHYCTYRHGRRFC